MKTKKEIEQLAESEYPIKRGGSMWMPCTHDFEKGNKQEGYINGYTQCQEDMADKKYTESQLRDAMEEAMAYSKLKQITEYINSLNKQD